jgi:hypothetical protein
MPRRQLRGVARASVMEVNRPWGGPGVCSRVAEVLLSSTNNRSGCLNTVKRRSAGSTNFLPALLPVSS